MFAVKKNGRLSEIWHLLNPVIYWFLMDLFLLLIM